MLTATALKRKFPPSPMRRRAWTWTRNGTAFQLSRRRIFGTGSGRRRVLSAGQLFVVAVRLMGHRLEIPDDADPGEYFQKIVSDIDLPPVKSLTGAAHMLVVIVVPAFTQSYQRQPKIVTALVASFVALPAE